MTVLLECQDRHPPEEARPHKRLLCQPPYLVLSQSPSFSLLRISQKQAAQSCSSPSPSIQVWPVSFKEFYSKLNLASLAFECGICAISALCLTHFSRRSQLRSFTPVFFPQLSLGLPPAAAASPCTPLLLPSAMPRQGCAQAIVICVASRNEG